MLHCSINTSITHKERTMDFQSLVERLREMFPNQYQSDIEEFISSKDPKTAADVEHWMQQWTYHSNRFQGL